MAMLAPVVLRKEELATAPRVTRCSTTLLLVSGSHNMVQASTPVALPRKILQV